MIHKRLEDILFLDIETAGQVARYEALTDDFKSLWAWKAGHIARDKNLSESQIAELFNHKVAIFAEFAKVICISVGFITVKNRKLEKFRCKSFYGDDEKGILISFIDLLKAHFDKPHKQALCGHNIKEFDIPFLCRRMTVHNLKVPKMLDVIGKKPWQVKHLLDTLDLWRFGDFKNYTSLKLLCGVLGIPSPKDHLEGHMIHSAYWDDGRLRDIVQYCEKDVFTVSKVYLRLNTIPYDEDYEFESTTEF